MIPYGRHTLDQDDIDAVVEVLKSSHLTQGPKITEFEEAISTHCQVPYAIATNSATSALHIACLALGVGRGDWVWTSAISFVASANCALYCGAMVNFIDVSPDTGNLCLDNLRQRLEEAKKSGKLPKVVIPVHYSGLPCCMKELRGLAEEYGFSTVEDASHALGAQYRGHPIGECSYSDITIFSFHPVKMITSAEGGMALTRSKELAKTMRMLASHGVTKNDSDFLRTPDGGWYYEQQMLGFNYRMSDVHAALGLSQLNKLDDFLKCRKDLACRYDKNFASTIVTLTQEDKIKESSYHLYWVKVPAEKRKGLYDYLRQEGVLAQIHYIPIPLQPYFIQLPYSLFEVPQAESFYSQVISLPIYPELTESDVDRICQIVLGVV